MCCQTKRGVAVYLDYVQAITGHRVTQDEWHALRDQARAAQPTADMSRTRVSQDTAEDIARTLITAIHPPAETDAPHMRLAAQHGAHLIEHVKDANVTRGTVTTLSYIADTGLASALRMAQDKVRRDEATHREHADLIRAALAAPNADLREGLLTAAAFHHTLGFEYAREWSSTDGEAAIPGLGEAYLSATQGKRHVRKFGMHSRKANEAVYKETVTINKAMRTGHVRTRADATRLLHAVEARLAEKYPEITDPGPRHTLRTLVNAIADEIGLDLDTGARRH